jgi:polyhydroxyalkanoate synthesis regulator phasin
VTRNTWPVLVAASAFTMALVGGVALAGFQPFATSDAATVGGPTAALTEKDRPKDPLKDVLDGLVAKNTITQAQADAIVQALKDARPSPKPNTPDRTPARPTVPNVMAFIGDLTKAAGAYLGVDPKALTTELRTGKSLAAIANATPGKNAQGLIDALTAAANARVDQAVAANKLTADQATTLKQRIVAEITASVNRSFTKPAIVPRPLTPVKPTPTPKS